MKNKKGVALLMVAIIIVLAVPITFMFLNLSTSQKEQAINFDNVLNIETVALSGINSGYSRLKQGSRIGYANYIKEVSGKDRYDLNLTPTGQGFFRQDIYLMLSKATDKDGKHSTIIMTDAEQFPPYNNEPSVVITHDYWHTVEPYELGIVADVLSMRNSRGHDQLRYLDVKKYEMETPKSKFENDIRGLKDSLPSDIKVVWDQVSETLIEEKVRSQSNTSNESSPTEGQGIGASNEKLDLNENSKISKPVLSGTKEADESKLQSIAVKKAAEKITVEKKTDMLNTAEKAEVGEIINSGTYKKDTNN